MHKPEHSYKTKGFDTRAIHAGQEPEPTTGAIMTPIYQTSTYTQAAPGDHRGYEYARTGNPGRTLLADAVAELENAAGAIVTGSGMSAIDLLLHGLPHGARVLCSHDAYGGTRRLLDARGRGGRLVPVYVDTSDLDQVANALNQDAALIIAETPSNPRLRISDLKGLARLARNAGTELAVDNTVMSPILQRPLDWGADYSVQSVTKLLNGHSDMVGGAVCCADPERVAELAWWANCVGVGAAAFDSYLALRGLHYGAVVARNPEHVRATFGDRLKSNVDYGLNLKLDDLYEAMPRRSRIYEIMRQFLDRVLHRMAQPDLLHLRIAFGNRPGVDRHRIDVLQHGCGRADSSHVLGELPQVRHRAEPSHDTANAESVGDRLAQTVAPGHFEIGHRTGLVPPDLERDDDEIRALDRPALVGVGLDAGIRTGR